LSSVYCKACLKLDTGVEEVGVRGVSQVSISTMISSRYCNSHITTSSVSRAIGQFSGQNTSSSAHGHPGLLPRRDNSIVAARLLVTRQWKLIEIQPS